MAEHVLRESRGVHPIPEMIERSVAEFSERVALQAKQGDTYRRITYRELKELVDALAAGLVHLGLGPDDRVAILGENRPEWAVAYLAIQRFGGTAVPLDVLLTAQEIEPLLLDSEARIVLTSGRFVSMLSEMGEQIPELRVVSMDPTDEAETMTFDDLLAGGRANPAAFSPSSLDDLAALIYTSGTTGRPKGVMLTHRNIVSDIDGSYRLIGIDPEDVFLSVLPLHHTFECTAGFLVPLCYGATITYARSLASRDLLADIRETGVTLMLGVPLLYEKMYAGLQRNIRQKPPLTRVLFRTFLGVVKGTRVLFRVRLGGTVFRGLREKAGLNSVRLMISGGAALSPKIAGAFNHLGLRLLQGYGLTETSPVLSINPPDRPRHRSVGVPIPGAEVKILDPDEEGIGEIAAKGDIVMAGYYQNPEATSEVIVDGWLSTGDSGRIDKDGYLYISGRLKNVIVTRGGKNVYPEEIENVLNRSPYILESMVYGADVLGGRDEEIRAIIVPDYEYLSQRADEQGQAFSDEEIESLVRNEAAEHCSEIAEYKRVRQVEIRKEEFPKTSTRKIKRYMVDT